MKPEIKQKIKSIIAEELIFPVKIITAKSLLVDLGADSLDLIELVMSIEEEFGIEFYDEEMENIETVNDIYKIVEDNLK